MNTPSLLDSSQNFANTNRYQKEKNIGIHWLVLTKKKQHRQLPGSENIYGSEAMFVLIYN